ncbi:hypothetical protein ACFV7R_29300 [Streptomyces sp. NPDC059866]|uniref:hypothetical protein n=1 Tax=Streptomyces sp. NPDC059866 TaxID=3346978 RepID=UPI00365D3EFC
MSGTGHREYTVRPAARAAVDGARRVMLDTFRGPRPPAASAPFEIPMPVGG